MSITGSASLYFHIPFCRRKCPYCSFYVLADKEGLKHLFRGAVAQEWKRQVPKLKNQRIASLYFGGGTPTLFAPEGIEAILADIYGSGLSFAENCEITLEANPEECTRALFLALRKLGINRLSLGVQSLDDRSLEILGRGHRAKKAKEAIFQAHEAGFQNISIDLMYDLPDQTEASWHYTLHQIKDLPIVHLSLYNLTIEPHTAFYRKKDHLAIPQGEASLRLLEMALDVLSQAGLRRYEISAFAKDGFQAVHNQGYWTGRPFLGFGPSAFSFWEGERFQNIPSLQRYANMLQEDRDPISLRERLSEQASLRERFAVYLRLLEGVPLTLFSSLSTEFWKALSPWVEKGFLERDAARVRLTPLGTLFYDEIASDLV